MRTKDERRHHSGRIKARAAAVFRLITHTQPSAAQVGKAAAMHNTCPCWACTHHDPEHQRKQMRDLNKLTKE